jgi:hypothetical protein
MVWPFGPNLIQLIAKGYAQIVSDVSFDVSEDSNEKKLLFTFLKQSKGWVKINLTDQVLFSLYLEPRCSDLQNFSANPP